MDLMVKVGQHISTLTVIHQSFCKVTLLSVPGDAANLLI
ncbi:putative phage/plasmid replication, II/X domain protein [Escherichia coli 2875150]|nr:putative phage/plasmid replication, II/X domain protein [Escherichia coli 2875150]